MWLALRLCRTAGITGLIECRNKVMGAAPFYWPVVDSPLKESVAFRLFFLHYHGCSLQPSAALPVPGALVRADTARQ